MLVRHTALYLLARGLPALINLSAIALYTRMLDTDEYGQYVVVVAAVSALNAVFFSWLVLAMERYLPAYGDSGKELIAVIAHIFLWLVGMTAILGTIVVVFFWHDHTLRWLAGLGAVMLWAQAWFELTLAIARSKFAPFRYGVLSTLKAGLAVCFGAILIVLDYGAIGALLGLLAGWTLASVGFGWREWAGARPVPPDRSLFRSLGAYGLPLTIVFFLNYLVSSSDRFLLGYLIDVGTVGVYAAGYDLAQFSVGFLMSAVNLAAFPQIIRAMKAGGISLAREQMRKNVLLLLGIAVPAVIGLCMLSENISNVILGNSFNHEASRIIPLIAIAVLLSGIKSFYVDLGFQLGHATQKQLWSIIGAAIVNILLNLLWIPRFGFVGAAYATIAAFAVGLCASMVLVRGVFPVPSPPKDTYKVLLASIPMALILWPMMHFQGSIVLIGQITCGVVVYTIFLWLLNPGGLRNKVNILVGR